MAAPMDTEKAALTAGYSADLMVVTTAASMAVHWAQLTADSTVARLVAYSVEH